MGSHLHGDATNGLELNPLSKLRAIGGKIEGIASDIGDSAAHAGKSFVTTVSSIPGSLTADSDFERIKSLDQLTRQHGRGTTTLTLNGKQ